MKLEFPVNSEEFKIYKLISDNKNKDLLNEEIVKRMSELGMIQDDKVIYTQENISKLIQIVNELSIPIGKFIQFMEIKNFLSDHDIDLVLITDQD